MNRRTIFATVRAGTMFLGLSLLALPRAALASNDPIPGVDVVVEKVPPGHVIGRLQSDRRGFLHFKSLEAGTYVVRDRLGNSAKIKHRGGPASWQLVGTRTNGKLTWTLLTTD
jgi:hypothetical protein